MCDATARDWSTDPTKSAKVHFGSEVRARTEVGGKMRRSAAAAQAVAQTAARAAAQASTQTANNPGSGGGSGSGNGSGGRSTESIPSYAVALARLVPVLTDRPSTD